ncbi:MAG: FtsQ-type POTRA domain-containing protein [Candidatus Caldatribacteriota bacterium]|nr:FtsQ-type POTRA domain-containing protein [Candidatus Caldatribacteriota bacterium]
MKLNNEHEEEKEPEEEEKKERYQAPVLKIIRIIVFYLVLGVLGWFFFNFIFSDNFFNVKEVIIEGNDTLKDEEIFKKSEIRIGENIFLLDLKKSINFLEKEPWIRKFEIKKIIPDKIKISIKERRIAAIVKIDDVYLKLSKNGIILNKFNDLEEDSNLPLILGLKTDKIKIGEKIIESGYRKALEIINCLKVILPKKFCKVEILDIDDFLICNIDNTLKVRANKVEEIINKENLLREAVEKVIEEKLSIEYIDLRFKDSLVISAKK